MARSDSSRACVPALWLWAFADRPRSLAGARRSRGLPVLVHVVSQRARVLRLRRTDCSLASIAKQPCCLPPSGESRRPNFAFFEAQSHPTHRYPCLRFKRHLAMSPARLRAKMESLSPFLVGLFHSLQHAGLSRRTLVNAAGTFALSYPLFRQCVVGLGYRAGKSDTPTWCAVTAFYQSLAPNAFVSEQLGILAM